MNSNIIYTTDDLVLGDIVRVCQNNHVYGKPAIVEYPISFNQVLLRKGNKFISILGEEYEVFSKEENGIRVKNVISMNEFFDEDFKRCGITDLTLSHDELEMLEYLIKNLLKEDVFEKFIQYREEINELE